MNPGKYAPAGTWCVSLHGVHPAYSKINRLAFGMAITSPVLPLNLEIPPPIMILATAVVE
jgi:hypothetical protein